MPAPSPPSNVMKRPRVTAAHIGRFAAPAQAIQPPTATLALRHESHRRGPCRPAPRRRLRAGRRADRSLQWLEDIDAPQVHGLGRGPERQVAPSGWRATRATRRSTPRRARSSPPRTASRRRASAPAGSTTSGRTRPTCTASGGTRRSASYRTASPAVGDAARPRRAVEGRGQELDLEGRRLPEARPDALPACASPTAAATRSRCASSTPRPRASSTAASGFPNGKQNVAWVDRDTLVASREWTPGEVTTSGYAYVVKLVAARREPREVFRGQKTDVSARAVRAARRGRQGRRA